MVGQGIKDSKRVWSLQNLSFIAIIFCSSVDTGAGENGIV